MFKIFDTHSHYYEESFDLDRESVIYNQFNSGVLKILNCGVDIESCNLIVDLINKYDFIYGACGIHPGYSGIHYGTNYIDKIVQYMDNEKILAVGEIGLDYFYKNLDIFIQKEVFKSQLDLAKQLNKPVVIHCRDAHFDTLSIVKGFMPIRGIIHCFSGSLDIAKEWVKLGFHLGISGIITFKNAVKIVEVVKDIPIEYLLTETDSPYLAPAPFRGKRNESINIEYIIRKISDIKNEDFYKIEDTLYKNALRFFNLYVY